MSARLGGARIARFGVVEADLQERILHRDGLKVRLRNQPFEVLAALLERPGETVTREELSRRVWPEGTCVEFEHSLSTATPGWEHGPSFSPDGNHVAIIVRDSPAAPHSLAGGDEHQLLPEVFRGNFAMASERVYFIPQLDVACGCCLLKLPDLATGGRTPLLDVKDGGGGLSVSSDGRSLLYTTANHTSGDLMLVEGFR